MNTELTERYLRAAVAVLPTRTQEDVRAELTASIMDATEARIDQGEDPAAAEQAALVELGDPAILAAEYADRPLHLIGPRYYLIWRRLLKLLLCIVPAVAAIGMALGQAIAGAPFDTLIGESLGVGISAGVHVAFWLTVVFVILERSGAETGADWDPDQLPELQSRGSGRADAIASVALTALFAAAILWDQLRGVVRIDGEPLTLLNPGLWPGWILVLLALLAAEVALSVTVLVRRRWTGALATLNTALAVLFMSWTLTLVGRAELVNPDFVDIVLRSNGVGEATVRTTTVLFVVTVLGASLWDIIDGWIKTARDRRR